MIAAKRVCHTRLRPVGPIGQLGAFSFSTLLRGKPPLHSMSESPTITEKTRAVVARYFESALQKHRAGEDPFKVVGSYAADMDGVLADLFERQFAAGEDISLVAVGGYGRRELCPYSDLDILILRESRAHDAEIQRFVTLLWDCGFDLGHSVRTLGECYEYMVDNPITGATLLENSLVAGSRRLYKRFLSSVVDRYRRREGSKFAASKIEQIRVSLDTEGRTIYILEPHLKDGVGALRDIQRVLWVENIRNGSIGFEGFSPKSVVSPERVISLREAYVFYLRVRCELHFLTGGRQEILENESVRQVAKNLFYDGDGRRSVEGLMADYFYHARNTYQFLKYYIEASADLPLGQRLKRRFFVNPVGSYLRFYNGKLYLRIEPPAESIAEEIVGFFVEAHRLDCPLSQELREWIRDRLADDEIDFTRSMVINRVLLSILREESGVSKVLRGMRRTGVLSRIIPEFSGLEGLVNFGGHHHYTVDEHTLRTLEKLDSLQREDVTEEGRPFREIFQSLRDPVPLRLALLLHEIGKAFEGNHEVSGSDAAGLICERFGLAEETADTIEFLVYRHLRMFKVSERQDYSEAGVIESFARLVGSEERLKMLYLMTYVDISSVGPGVWTGWKGAQLSDLYERTLEYMRGGESLEQSLDEELTASGLEAEAMSRVKEHCESIGTPSYRREIVPERMLVHVDMVAALQETGKAQIRQDSFLDFHEITICWGDRNGLVSDITGVLYSEGLNVLGARVFSRSDGVAVDLFHVEVADETGVPVKSRIENIRAKLEAVAAGEEDVEVLIKRWRKTNRYSPMLKHPRPLYGPSVKYNNSISEACTVIEINAGDRTGLLHDEASVLSQLGLDVRAAKISTIASRARGVFYVLDSDGKKIESRERMARIEKELIARVKMPPPGGG